MNKIWEIRERTKQRDGMFEGYKGKSMRGMRSGYKDKESYEMGYYEGYCDVLEKLDKFLEEHSSE